MKRDMELVRQILLAVEGHPSAVEPCELRIPGFSEEQIAYHTQLLHEAGFLEGIQHDLGRFFRSSPCASSRAGVRPGNALHGR
ncbi:MAG: DUF2513 domain-containing protein [Thermoguttaceae bacterium]|jgi:hypothetical protein|nr:DUF2513 domain-containing protein [Thermoguttaceae bacterium]